MGGDCL